MAGILPQFLGQPPICFNFFRHLVENAFAKLKHYRAVATRYDKLTRHYESIVSLACAFLWLPM